MANGNQPEFSPSGARIAWIDGTRAKGRLRRGDPTVYVLAKNVEPAGGVHWLSESEVAVILRRDGRKAWYRVDLHGGEAEIPELTRLGTGGYECDVKLGADGVWSYVAKVSWKTSDGGSGRVPGTCSVSLSPDGRTVTSLHNPHKRCDLTAIRTGGIARTILWPFADGYDNHRFASSDPRFIVAVDEGTETMVVMTVDGERYTRVGTLGHADGGMYGDWASGRGAAQAWLPDGREPEDGGDWPRKEEEAVFLWDHGEASNTLAIRPPEESLCRLSLAGEARLGGSFELLLSGGSARAEEASARAALRDLERAGAGTLELVLGGDQAASDGIETIVSLGAGDDGLELFVRAGELVLALDGEELDLGALRGGAPEHVVVSWGSIRAVAYRNGREVARLGLSSPPAWPAAVSLTFGAYPDGSRDWSGWIEGIALYRVALSAGDVRANHALRMDRLAARAVVTRWNVEAVLLRKRPLPRPDLYPQTLVAFDYLIDGTRAGAPFSSSEEVSVVHWGVLDGRIQRLVQDRSEARTYRLALEPWGDHPELQRFKLVADEDVREVGWFDVTPPSEDAELR